MLQLLEDVHFLRLELIDINRLQVDLTKIESNVFLQRPLSRHDIGVHNFDQFGLIDKLDSAPSPCLYLPEELALEPVD